MTAPHIVVASPSGAAVARFEAIRDAARTRGSEAPVVTFITWAAVDAPDCARVITLGRSTESVGALERRMRASAIGRNLIRMTPLDGSRRFAAAIRSNPEARDALVSATALIASERDAILAIWKAARRTSRDVPARFGVQAGIAALESR